MKSHQNVDQRTPLNQIMFYPKSTQRHNSSHIPSPVMSPHTPVAGCPARVTPTSHNTLARTQVIVEQREEVHRGAAHAL